MRSVLREDEVLIYLTTVVMLRLGNQIRLTRREAETFMEITNFQPAGIRTEADLRAYVDECKRYYRGRSYEARFLHWLIDQQIGRCIRGPTAG